MREAHSLFDAANRRHVVVSGIRARLDVNLFQMLLTTVTLVLLPHAAFAQESWFLNQFAPTDIVSPRSKIPARASPAHISSSASTVQEVPTPKIEPRAWRTVVLPAKPESVIRVASAGAAFVPQLPAKPLTGYAHEMAGLASFYWEDQMTSSGERFDKRGMTAAHKTLPFGTRVRVTNVSNGKSTIVRINDRGPFKGGRVIDLSQAAATQIDMTGRGIVRVALEVVN